MHDMSSGRRDGLRRGRAARRRCAIAVLGAVLALDGLAHARPAGDAAAAAAELFQQGRQALLDGRLEAACSQLAESQRLDPKVGTLINLAQCEERRGKLAGALQRWSDARALAQQTADRRADFVARQQAALDPRVPRLSIRARDVAGEGVHVVVDDGPARTVADLAGPIAVDPGAHVVKVTQPGHADASFPVTIAEGASAEVDVRVGPAVEAPAPAAAAPSEAASVQWGGTQHVLAYVSAGLGLVSVGVGSVFGAQAISARNDPNCNGGVCSTQADAQTQRNGVTAGNVATGLIIAGGALVAGGVVLWLTAPRATVATGAGRGSWIGVAPQGAGGLLTAGASW
jgi:hypothetical protein